MTAAEKEVNPEELPERDVVYLGRRPGQSGTAYLLITLERLQGIVKSAEGRTYIIPLPYDVTREVDAAASWFKLKKKPCNTIGAVYSVRCEVDDKGKLQSFVSSQMRFKDRLKEENLQAFVPAWGRLDEEVNREKQMASLENNANTDPQTKRALETLRDRYKKVPPATRMAFKMWLIAEMEKK